MNKKSWIILILILIAIPIGWYLISPLFITVELQEESPIINDAMDSMNPKKRAEFDAAVKIAQEETSEINEEMLSAKILLQGVFKPRAHEVEGKVLLIEDNGKKILRFEDFDTINGPNLHIYLSSDLGDEKFIDLGRLKATKGSFNYELEDDFDAAKYNKILVWCVPFRILFSYAELK